LPSVDTMALCCFAYHSAEFVRRVNSFTLYEYFDPLALFPLHCFSISFFVLSSISTNLCHTIYPFCKSIKFWSAFPMLFPHPPFDFIPHPFLVPGSIEQVTSLGSPPHLDCASCVWFCTLATEPPDLPRLPPPCSLAPSPNSVIFGPMGFRGPSPPPPPPLLNNRF